MNNIRIIRDLMRHQNGTKFYDVMLVVPLDERGNVDATKQGFCITRWGKILTSMTKGGSFGQGRMLSMKNQAAARNYYDAIVANKSGRGYLYTGSEAIEGEKAHNLLKTTGVTSQDIFAEFAKQFPVETAASKSESYEVEDDLELDDDFSEHVGTSNPFDSGAVIAAPKRKERSQLFGSW